jgi:hypothetical protein
MLFSQTVSLVWAVANHTARGGGGDEERKRMQAPLVVACGKRTQPFGGHASETQSTPDTQHASGS